MLEKLAKGAISRDRARIAQNFISTYRKVRSKLFCYPLIYMNIFLLSQRIARHALMLLFVSTGSFAATSGGNVTVIGLESYQFIQPIEKNKETHGQTYELELTVAYFPAAGWEKDVVVATVSRATALLGQCGVMLAALELTILQGSSYFQDFSTPAARDLARRVPLRRPTVYFLADTLQQPAFDAEAIGRGNSRTRPELADTVWVMRGTRDLDLVVAHELAHVLMNSGDHTALPGNLMREETSPENVGLTASQCARLQQSGTAHGLLTPRP